MMHEPKLALREWDFLLSSQFVSGFGALDAHTKTILGFPVIRYPMLFEPVTMYTEAQADETNIVNNLVKAKSFIVFEPHGGIVSHFRFEAISGGRVYETGSKISSELPTTFIVQVPRKSRIRLLRNGQQVAQINSKTLQVQLKNPGAYRVEVLQHGRIWILSNAIIINA